MLERVLGEEPREQAGAESYNRFEYQVHYAVNHVIKNIEDENDFIIFCEYHDDFSEAQCIDTPSHLNFYQVKTNDVDKKWTLSKLFQKDKNKDGTYKKSFIGYMFYNFKKFQDACNACYFVSNIEFCDETKEWQECIRSNQKLKLKNQNLYDKIRQKLLMEYQVYDKFDLDFDKFIENTIFIKSELPLNNYEKIVSGNFFKMISYYNIHVDNAFRLFNDLLYEVREKSKKKISVPIGYKELCEKKGISSIEWKKLQSKLCIKISNSSIDKRLDEFINKLNLSLTESNIIKSKLKKHFENILNPENSFYIEKIIEISEEIRKVLCEVDVKSFSIKSIEEKVLNKLEKYNTDEVDKYLIRGIIYDELSRLELE